MILISFTIHTNQYHLKIFFGKDGMDFMNEDLRAHKPFRNLYLEISRWNDNNTFYSKVGYHSHYSYDNSSAKNYQSLIQFQLNL